MPLNTAEFTPNENTLYEGLIGIIEQKNIDNQQLSGFKAFSLLIDNPGDLLSIPLSASFNTASDAAANALRCLKLDVDNIVYRNVTPHKTEKAKNLIQNLETILKELKENTSEEFLADYYIRILDATNQCLKNMKWEGIHCENPITRIFTFSLNPFKTTGLTVNTLNLLMYLIKLTYQTVLDELSKFADLYFLGEKLNHMVEEDIKGVEGKLLKFLKENNLETKYVELKKALQQLRNTRLINPLNYGETLSKVESILLTKLAELNKEISETTGAVNKNNLPDLTGCLFRNKFTEGSAPRHIEGVELTAIGLPVDYITSSPFK